ncbi:family 78 glycoside hydrolase catalytic domain [Phyllobacterium leguminum]|uniref:alpha-L-rhamnosidase n=1 Tax=Phyllobacterium leguminum TaxID=314237 RepID=A0A318T367_9HYPH|nr:family 78 glycoside hydrolase catalytic domain [Phyllobacterium leguminum]PYE87293.1 alpha-L-rhamnosidase-like protein [Phyllobacterium leguminum]
MLVRRRHVLSALAGATILAGGAGYFFSRPASTTVWRPVTAKRSRQDGAVHFVDFGKVWFGNIIITPDDENKGTPVILRLGEKLGTDGRIDRHPFGTVRYYEIQTTLGDVPFSPPLTPADLRGMESGKPAMPFRYVEIEGWRGALPEGAVTLESVVSDKYEARGGITFTSGSETAAQLNRLMELGEHTMAATSFMGLFVDGDRERIPYQADGYINQLGWYMTTGDWTVPRRTIDALFKAPTWPSEWMVQLIFMVWADYQATGDKDYLAEIFDRLKIYTLFWFVDDTGLVNTTNKALADNFARRTKADYLEDIVDWPQGERDGYDMRPYNTVVNAFVHAGFVLMAAMADELGRPRDANTLRGTAEKLRLKIQEKLIDRQRGIFVDGLGSTHAAAHSTFFPLAFDLVPPEQVNASLAHIETRIAAHGGGFPCSVYGAQYLLEGLFRHGAGHIALPLMLNRTERGWLHMMDKYDATVTHEAWDVKFKENIDWTHAWGAAFLDITQRFILGARMLAPRWARWTLQPDPWVAESMRATIPTPHGTIHAEVDAQNRTITVQAPAETKFQPPAGGYWKVLNV